MASSTASNYLYTRMLDKALKGVDYTPNSVWYVALMRSLPNSDGTGGQEVSVSGTGYGRKPLTGGSNGWSGPNGAALEYVNAADIQFDQPTGDWGTIVGIALYDAQVGGNLLFTGRGTSKVVAATDGAPVIMAGQLKLNQAYC